MAEDLKVAPNGQIQPIVVDPHEVAIQFVDWIVTSGIGPAPGILNLNLSAIDYSLTGDVTRPQAIIQCRLRMSLVTAQNIANNLQQLLDSIKTAGPDDVVN